MSDINSWLTKLAKELGLQPLSEDEIASVLSIASVAAHGCERQAAPLTCWLLAKTGLSPLEGLDIVEQLASEFQ